MCILSSFFFNNFQAYNNKCSAQTINRSNQSTQVNMNPLSYWHGAFTTLGASFVNPSSHSCGAFSTLTTSSCVFLRILMEIFLQSHLGNLFSSRASSAFGHSLDFTTIEQHLSSLVQPNVKKCHLQQQFFDTNDWSTHSSQHEYPFALAWNCLRNNWLIDWLIDRSTHSNMNPISHWRGAYLTPIT